ncbi:hypothetical protein [Leptolyngbya sp. FACHB-711]|uniref:hypothetical protein n=1 Tax=unclassified Leptolyngbya TaxID=2650499 RepID=UPI00168567BC|nr:hypothetical protein [Leptolyngbya sp. FACHB-711]MBD1850331.1 hypothetical protein [Cyanobacteria bacterium FACHB-502]MBD2027170.1 hypothetical protein [Leptolyngbya sp. FACHB-711]
MEAILLSVLAIFGIVFWQDTAPKKKDEKPKTPEQKLLEALAEYEQKKDGGKKTTKIVVEINDR